jgi:hypothetical protein
MKKTLFVGALLLLLSILLAACSTPAPTAVVTEAPTAVPCPTCPPIPECPTCPDPIVKDVPFQDEWANSPHADAESEAFIHWNEDDPAEVPASCAKCHSTPGYLDFVGADGSAAGAVDVASPIGTVVECVACHNAATATKTSVVFPSGVEVTGLGAEARCMECHQGRASSVQVNAALEENGMTEDLDTPNAELRFINIHYFAAASTLYGTQTKGGYEYAGKTYDFKNDHVEGYDTCIGCHNSHTLELKVDACATCHTGVASVEDVRAIRMQGSQVDYDGDGDLTEGIAAEVDGLKAMLYQAIQAYGTEKAGTAIAYDSSSHPYFFIDGNANGTVDEDELNSDNAYNAWTGRLLKAAYNFQTASKDPGAYAHGGKYIIQLVYDSIEDLNSVLSTPVDLSTAARIDHGHFAGSEEAFRHWDEDGEVEAGCAKCHSATGLPLYLEEGVNISTHVANGLNCSTCHNSLADYTLYTVERVQLPSGKSVSFGETDNSNICLNCHQGRESVVSVNAAIARSGATGDDAVTEGLNVRNPHYFAAAGTLFGSEASGAYEYAGKEYNGQNLHANGFSTCINCHNAHALENNLVACAGCHTGVSTAEDLQNIRMDAAAPVDYDGDGDTTEGVANEIATLEEALYAAIQAYAADTVGTPIVYNGTAYPYFFVDTNADGVADADEMVRTNGYSTWTPRMLRAVYNFLWIAKDPGAYAHNADYSMQVLYDSLQDIGGGGAVSGLTRPPVATPAP